MKTSFNFIASTAIALLISMTAISSVHAFAIDFKLGANNPGSSSDATELAAIKTFANDTTLTRASKVESGITLTSNGANTGAFYIDVGTAMPAYFLLKFGGGNMTGFDHFYFRNDNELSKLVFSNSQVNSLFGSSCGTTGGTCDLTKLSHFATFTSANGGGAGNGVVPEPATIAMLGLGLLGIAMFRRKARK